MIYEIEPFTYDDGSMLVLQKRTAVNLIELAWDVFPDFPEADYFLATDRNGATFRVPRAFKECGFNRIR